MKKICLLLLFVSVISALPSYSKMVIVNDQNDRVVYSRSSKYDYDVSNDYNNPNSGYKNANYQNVQNNSKDLDYYRLKLLSDSIKQELIGTTWYYDYSQMYSAQVEKNGYDETITDANTEDDVSKRFSREAADYYIKNLANNPVVLVPSGFEY